MFFRNGRRILSRDSMKEKLKMLEIIQAPMAGVTTPELVSEVSNAGCLGSHAAGYSSAEKFDADLQSIEKKTKHAYAVNLFIPNKEVQHYNESDLSALQETLNDLRNELDIPEKSGPPRVPDLKKTYEDTFETVLASQAQFVSCTFGAFDEDEIARYIRPENVSWEQRPHPRKLSY